MGKYIVHRKDANEPTLVEALVATGASVTDGGPLDLIVGLGGSTYLLEVKTKGGKLRKSQQEFLDAWNGHAAVVRTPEEALRAIGVIE